MNQKLKSAMMWLCFFFFIISSCQNSKQTKPTGSDTVKESKTNITIKSNEFLSNAESLIVPGERIGKVKLGEEVSSLKILGMPDQSDAAMGKAWLFWRGKKDKHNNITELDVYTASKDNTMQEKTVQQVRTTSSAFFTEKKIHVYSSFDSIEQNFPEIKKLASYKDAEKNVLIYDAVEKGIAFEITKLSGRKICTGIIVHEKNKPVTEIYIMLHPGMQKL